MKEVDVEIAGGRSLQRSGTDPPTTVLNRIVTRTLSRTADGAIEPPPDGGWRAWFQVFLAFLAVMNIWGYVQAYGVFQTYYVATLARPPSDIAWVGSFQVFLLFFVGTFSGRATDAGYFRPVFRLGSLLSLVGVFTTSCATTYWQLLLAQGVCQGLANGLLFCSLMSVLSSYFDRHRALALNIIACGTSLGALLYGGMVEALLPHLGFAWTVRAIGLVMLLVQIAAVVGVRPRLPPRRTGPFLDRSALTEAPFVLFSVRVHMEVEGCLS